MAMPRTRVGLLLLVVAIVSCIAVDHEAAGENADTSSSTDSSHFVGGEADNVASSIDGESATNVWAFEEVFDEVRDKKSKPKTLVEHSDDLAKVVNGPGFSFSLITTPTSEKRPNSHCPLYIATNPTRRSHHGVSIGHKQSHSEIEVRIGDGRNVESIKFKHDRVPLDSECNRTVRLVRENEGRVLDVWVNGNHVGNKQLPKVGGDLYSGEGGVVFGNVWDWSFTGTLGSLTINEAHCDSCTAETTRVHGKDSGDSAYLDTPTTSAQTGGNSKERSASQRQATAQSVSPHSATATTVGSTAWFEKEFDGSMWDEQQEPRTIVPHSPDLPTVINGAGFTMSVVTTALSDQRPFSHCPLYVATNPTEPVHNGLSIGHESSHSQLEVRLGDGHSVESVIFPHDRVKLGEPCNRTLRLQRDGSLRELDVWIDGQHVGSKSFSNLRGDLYTGGNGIVFGDVWGWSFRGILNNLALSPLRPDEFSRAVSPEKSLDNTANGTESSLNETTGASTDAFKHLWYHKTFTNATGHFAVVPDEREKRRRSFGRSGDKTPGGEPMGPLDIIPHSEELGRVVNGKGFILSIVSTPDGNGGKPGRSLSQCPVRISDNPRSDSDYGFSIGHHASDKGLEIRMADGTAFVAQTIQHDPQDWSTKCNRTVRISRSSKELYADVEDENGRTAELWINGVYMGHAHFPGVSRDLYDTRKGGVLGDVWGWGFSGTLHSVSLSPIWNGDLVARKGRSAEELEAMFGEDEFEFDPNLDGEDEDILDEDLDELEEFVFHSPGDVQDQWKHSIAELKKFAKEAERKGDEEALEQLPDSCKWGMQSCMHDVEGPLFKRAQEEAKVRRTVQDEKTGGQLISALLPSLAAPDVKIGMLPMFNGESQTSSDDNESTSTAAPHDGNAIAVAALQQSAAAATAVSMGTIVNVGALTSNLTETSERAAASRERKHKRRYGRDRIDVAWQLATETAEKRARENLTALARRSRAARNSNQSDPFKFPTEEDNELFEWFEAGGGRLNFVEVRPQGRFKQHRALLADEDLSSGDEVVSVPFKLTLNRITMRNVGLGCKGKCSFLSEHFGPVFEKDEEWGLAVLLLHEHAKGNESRWWPFIRTLKMHVLSKKVVQELDGTYALELDRFHGESAEAALDFVNKELCRMHKPEACNFGKTRKDMRWALGVVRRFSFNLTKSTSGKPFLSLVPYGNLLRHRAGAGGACVLGLDNVVRFQIGEDHPEGTALTIEYV